MTEAAFLALYEQSARPLKALLARLTGEPCLAEELLQESFYRLWRARLSDGTPEAELRAYLYRIATNLVRDHFRRRKFRPESLDPGESPQDARVPKREFAAPMAEEGAALDAARLLDRLRPRDREILWLAYAEGFSHREIAATTGMKEASIRPLLYRIRQQVADWFGRPMVSKEGGLR
jgi:RNA polymerase sigma-70 factor (ECF subfamily)